MKVRTQQGIGIPIRKAETISFSDKQQLWSLGLLGTSNPEQLLNTVAYLLGLYCALRAGKEHRSLHSIPFESQFTFLLDDSGKMYFKYVEDLGLKTNKGGLHHHKFTPKIVYVYQVEDVRCCPVHILYKYMSLLPSGRKCTALYLQRRSKYSDEIGF